MRSFLRKICNILSLMCYSCYMDLNIRKVPAELMARLKSEAALMGTTLREHCLARLGAVVEIVEPQKPVKQAVLKQVETLCPGCRIPLSLWYGRRACLNNRCREYEGLKQ